MTDADRRTLHDTALGLHELQQIANSAAEAVTTLGPQVQAAEAMLKAAGNGSATECDRRISIPVSPTSDGAWVSALEEGARAAAEVAAASAVSSRMSAVRSGSSRGRSWGRRRCRPRSKSETAGELREDMLKLVQETNDLIASVPALYDKLGAAGLKPASLKPITAPAQR